LLWRPENFRRRVLAPLMRRAVDDGIEPWRLKDLRHTWITLLLEGGVPVSHVAAWAGHRVAMHDAHGTFRLRTLTYDVYNHPSDRHVPAACALIRAYLHAGRDLDLVLALGGQGAVTADARSRNAVRHSGGTNC
jgi:integrase